MKPELKARLEQAQAKFIETGKAFGERTARVAVHPATEMIVGSAAIVASGIVAAKVTSTAAIVACAAGTVAGGALFAHGFLRGFRAGMLDALSASRPALTPSA